MDRISEMQQRHEKVELGWRNLGYEICNFDHAEGIAAHDHRGQLLAKVMRLREVLSKMSHHPTGGVGCNPVEFVLAASRSLDEEELR